jgi:hypothetical protein
MNIRPVGHDVNQAVIIHGGHGRRLIMLSDQIYHNSYGRTLEHHNSDERCLDHHISDETSLEHYALPLHNFSVPNWSRQSFEQCQTAKEADAPPDGVGNEAIQL